MMDAYVRLLDSLIRIDVIVGGDNGPRPKKPYAALWWPENILLTPVHRGKVAENGERVNAVHHSTTLQVHIYGPGSTELASELAMRLFEDESIDTALEDYGISWNTTPRIMPVPQLMDDATYEPRAILEIETSYTVSLPERVGVIETVTGDLTTTPGTDTIASFIATVEPVTGDLD